MKLLANERDVFIIKTLEQNRIIKVTKAAVSLNVSEKTIREDLKRLEEQGLLIRIHGGACLPDEEGALLPIDIRRKSHMDNKAVIAKKAIQFIEENDTIVLDSGTTLLELAKILPDIPMTVITNDLFIIQEITKKSNIHLYVPGGSFTSGSTSLLGEDAENRLRQFRTQKAFMGTTCVHPKHGLSLISHVEVSLKKIMIQQAEKVFLLVDHTKWNKIGLFPFASLKEIDVIISDTNE
jgi:DeoR family fructose operon transcriptional repressor